MEILELLAAGKDLLCLRGSEQPRLVDQFKINFERKPRYHDIKRREAGRCSGVGPRLPVSPDPLPWAGAGIRAGNAVASRAKVADPTRPGVRWWLAGLQLLIHTCGFWNNQDSELSETANPFLPHRQDFGLPRVAY